MDGVAAIDASAENSDTAKTQSAEAMNINTSLQAFSNSIPSRFGNARDRVYSSAFEESLSIPGNELAPTDTIELTKVELFLDDSDPDVDRPDEVFTEINDNAQLLTLCCQD